MTWFNCGGIIRGEYFIRKVSYSGESGAAEVAEDDEKLKESREKLGKWKHHEFRKDLSACVIYKREKEERERVFLFLGKLNY